jgi:hypothetical protein
VPRTSSGTPCAPPTGRLAPTGVLLWTPPLYHTPTCLRESDTIGTRLCPRGGKLSATRRPQMHSAPSSPPPCLPLLPHSPHPQPAGRILPLLNIHAPRQRTASLTLTHTPTPAPAVRPAGNLTLSGDGGVPRAGPSAGPIAPSPLRIPLTTGTPPHRLSHGFGHPLPWTRTLGRPAVESLSASGSFPGTRPHNPPLAPGSAPTSRGKSHNRARRRMGFFGI